jgi:hypothetical protein
MKKHPRVPRYRFFFYRRNATPDDYGEVDDTYTAVTSGFFAREKARRPMEIADASATVNEIQYVLVGAYVKRYFTDISAEMLAWCPQTDKVYEVIGEPIDNEGNNRQTMIYVADNVRRVVDTSALPTEYTN